MRKESYIGLFRAFPKGSWRVTFPDLPGCEARGGSFREVFTAAREALADHLAELPRPWPRPRSTAELSIDAQRDWRLCREFVDAVMHPVEPAEADALAPLDLVAVSARNGGGLPPQLGA